MQLALHILLSILSITYAMGPHAPAHAPVYAPSHVSYAPPYYHYTYNVLDEYAGLNYGHQEDRVGDKTIGEYHVLLPDGRIQTVNYHVDDDYSGRDPLYN